MMKKFLAFSFLIFFLRIFLARADDSGVEQYSVNPMVDKVLKVAVSGSRSDLFFQASQKIEKNIRLMREQFPGFYLLPIHYFDTELSTYPGRAKALENYCADERKKYENFEKLMLDLKNNIISEYSEAGLRVDLVNFYEAYGEAKEAFSGGCSSKNYKDEYFLALIKAKNRLVMLESSVVKLQQSFIKIRHQLIKQIKSKVQMADQALIKEIAIEHENAKKIVAPDQSESLYIKSQKKLEASPSK